MTLIRRFFSTAYFELRGMKLRDQLYTLAIAGCATIYKWQFAGGLSAKEMASYGVPAVWIVAFLIAWLTFQACRRIRAQDLDEWKSWKPLIIGADRPSKPGARRLGVIVILCWTGCLAAALLTPRWMFQRSPVQSPAQLRPGNSRSNGASTDQRHDQAQHVSTSDKRKTARPAVIPKRLASKLANGVLFPNSSEKQLPRPVQQSQQLTELSAHLVNNADPALIVQNNSDVLADRITWELVMFRKTDQAFMSYDTQSIGYVKPHQQSAAYSLDLNLRGHAPQTPPIVDGDSFVGSLAVDCPTCKGLTLLVGFTWRHDGWFYELPDGDGKLIVPHDMSGVSIKDFLSRIEVYVTPEMRHSIM